MGASKYRLLRAIRRGGTSEIFEALIEGEAGFARRCALKLLLPEHIDDPILVERFQEEARLLAELHSARVVSIFDVGNLAGRPFQALELVDGLDLGALIARSKEQERPLPPALVLFIVGEVASILDDVHQAKDSAGASLGVVHRDLTPENVLLSWSGELKLADFGVADWSRRRRATQVGTARGQLAYLAPEIVRGELADPKADVFALGLIAVALATGQSPLATEESRRDLLLGESPPIDPSVPEDLRAVIQDATRAARDDRTTAAELARSAFAAAAKRGVSAGRIELAAHLKTLQGEAQQRHRPLSELMRIELVVDPTDASGAHYHSKISPSLGAPIPTQDGDDDERSGARLLGSILESYRLDALLGFGSQGNVFRAMHLGLGRPCAIKLLSSDAAREPARLRRFRREIDALIAVEHPSLVKVLEWGWTPPFLAMELVHGRRLDRIVADRAPIDRVRIVRWASQIAAGLDAAHRVGVIHRDLAPSNVMIAEVAGGELVKILDFGLALLATPANVHTHITQANARLGSARWVAPEQIENASAVDARADLYALGSLLYYLISGHPPFDDDPVSLHGKLGGELPPPLDSDEPLAPLIFALLSRDPAARPASAQAVLEQLTALRPLGLIRPARSTPRERSPLDHSSSPHDRQPPVRWTWLILMFAMLTVLVSAGTVLVFAGRSRSPASAERRETLDAPPIPKATGATPSEESAPRALEDAPAEPAFPAGRGAAARASHERGAKTPHRDPTPPPGLPLPPPPETPALIARLAQARSKLEAAAGQVPAERLSALERRYLDVRASVQDAGSVEERQRWNAEVTDLERSIERSLMR